MPSRRFAMEHTPEGHRRHQALAQGLACSRAEVVRRALRLLEEAQVGEAKGLQLALVDNEGRVVSRLVRL